MLTEVINIGTTSLETYSRGSTGPTVVIETGMGSSMYDWHAVISEASERARVLIYHREGYGSSILTSERCSTKKIANNLYSLLEKKQISEHIILVGHSFGGLCTHHFAMLYPTMVSALILVDSTPMEMYKIEALKRSLSAIQDRYPTDRTLGRMKKLANMSKQEIIKEVNPRLSEYQSRLPTDIKKQINEFLTNPNLYKATASEFENMIDSGRAVEALTDFPDIPLKVIVRDEEIEINNLLNAGIPQDEAVVFESLIQDLNKEKSKCSNKGELIKAKGAGHNIHLECPDIIISAIRDLI